MMNFFYHVIKVCAATRIGLLFTLLLFLFSTNQISLIAISPSDLGSIINTRPWYDETDQGGNVCAPGGTPGTTLSDNIPSPHREVFTQAAQRYDVNPQYIAALFLSEQGNVWKDINSTWASSPVGASGPFQFMPGTWTGYGVDGNGDGRADIQNFEDSAHSAANLISTGFNVTIITPLGDLNTPVQTGTFLRAASEYNWGPGNVSSKTNPSSPISALPGETQNYVRNIYTLITSDFTLSGHSNYPNPDGSSSPGASNTCVSNLGGVIQIAEAELAKNVVEYDSNVLKYSDGNREPWCADFVSWVFKEAGVPFTGGLSGGWRIPSVLSMQSWFKTNATYFNVGDQTPRPGDVAFYIGSQTPDGGSQSHVNIVIEVNGDTMTTIGGNEGDRVTKSVKSIRLDEQGLVGFGRK